MTSVKTLKGTELPLIKLQGKDYLQVAHRVVWFRQERPNWSIQTLILQRDENSCLVRAEIFDDTGRSIQTSHGFESKADFKDFIEKSETKAIGRALANLGYGTAFAIELDEMPRIVDTPMNPKQKPIIPVIPGNAISPVAQFSRDPQKDEKLAHLKKTRTKEGYSVDDVRKVARHTFGQEDLTKLSPQEIEAITEFVLQTPIKTLREEFKGNL